MRYDFDLITDRKNTNSLKYDFAAERGMPAGVIPMWVADMDFPTPPEVIADIESAVKHGIFGYTEAKDDYYDAVIDWFGSRFGYAVKKDEIVKTPGVVYALAQAVRAFTEAGDGVIIQTPVYYPFYEVIRANGRKVITNPLKYTGGRYEIDFDDFKRKIANAKLFLLCSPHNPVGRVWTREELQRLSTICKENGVQVVSDEIHCDFVWTGHVHTCYGLIDDTAVIATAPSKSFNLAGLQVSNIFIKNAQLRAKFTAEINRSGYSQLNTLGITACRSAYTRGGEWLTQLKAYIESNIKTAKDFIADNLPDVKLVEPEGTYLLWLDFSAYNLSQQELDKRITYDAGLWLDGGTMFGKEGGGFQRMNIACPKSVLLAGLRQIANCMGD
jgi:cystathionine beta-lyase